MSGKDAEIERAFERAEKDAERREAPGAHFPGPLPIWKDPIPCPGCSGLASFKMKCGKRWYAACLPCNRYWPLETDNERENG